MSVAQFTKSLTQILTFYAPSKTWLHVAQKADKVTI